MRGIVAVLLLVVNLFIIPVLVMLVGLVGKLIPIRPWHHFCRNLAEHKLTPLWIDVNSFCLRLAAPTKIRVEGKGLLEKKGWYCLIANHQSWLDILLLQKIFNRKIPVLKFFMKQSLIWKLPIAGLACWAIDFPFMKRYSKAYLKRHPEKKGKDREITRKACEKFQHLPVTVTTFLEGTRFTEEKHALQASPYHHLLRPHASNLALILYALQNCLDSIINVTIIYPDNRASFWRYLFGKMNEITICYEVFSIPPELKGDYYEDKEFRKQFQTWLNDLWQEKDKKLSGEKGTQR